MQKRNRPNRQPRRGNAHSSSTSSSNLAPSHTQKPSHSRPPRHQPLTTSVPSYASLTPGTSVSIILKQDQPTGHQVQGFVSELLTRGDHPRGVKVRLRDGRVGRVQRVVGEEEGARGEERVGGAEAGLGRNGESDGSGGYAVSRGGMGGRRGGFKHVKDVREDDEYLYDESRTQGSGAGGGGYFAALEAADARHAENRGWGGQAGERHEVKSEMAVCPVCGVFEGDERAVAHHVEEHFGGGE